MSNFTVNRNSTYCVGLKQFIDRFGPHGKEKGLINFKVSESRTIERTALTENIFKELDNDTNTITPFNLICIV